MRVANLEYILLRLVRRFFFNEALLLRVGQWLPYYRVNYNQVDSSTIVDRYLSMLEREELEMDGITVLEIGAGSTNSTAYALAARTPTRRIWVYEPFVKLQSDLDLQLLKQIASDSARSDTELRKVVARLTDFSEIVDHTVDMILSHSVLEHVSDPITLFAELDRVLKPGGAMLHIVDYRDHFFKYPYHFLQFSKWTWNRLLNPGDLPRWRLSDHLKMLRRAGFVVTVLASTRDDESFKAIKAHLSPDFDPADPDLPVQTAAIFVVRDAPLVG